MCGLPVPAVEEAPMVGSDVAVRLDVSRETLQRFETHLSLLARWNPRINLVGPSTLADPWRRHILDSGQLFRHLADPSRTLVDIGSGAGFPGLVLACMGAGDVHLVEPDQRKAVFLREAARECGVTVQIHRRRADLIRDLTAQVVTSRALAAPDRMIAMGHHLLEPGGQFLLLVGRAMSSALTDWAADCKVRYQRYPSLSDPTGSVLVVEEWDDEDYYGRRQG